MSQNKYRLIKPIPESQRDYDQIETMIRRLLRDEIYRPLMRELPRDSGTLKNAKRDILSAIAKGRITYYQGRFRGRFDSETTKELRKLGATWDKKTATFVVPNIRMTQELRDAVHKAQDKFNVVLQKIDEKLQKIIPAATASKLTAEKYFDNTISVLDQKVKKSLRGITVEPYLTKAEKERISREYTQNLQLYIKKFVEEETVELREKIQKRVLRGQRYEGVIDEIQKSYNVSANKAKFLARQETSLMMTKFKQVRYQDAGVNEYKWACVQMPHQAKNAKYKPGDVRYHHGILEGKVFSWSNPPIVNDNGDRKNPGQDYNCRCFAIPIVRF